MKFFLLSVLNVTATILLISLTPVPFFWCCPLIRGSLPSCLLYQRDLHLKKPTVPPLCSMLACSSTNRPWPTCSFSSRLPSYHQVRAESSSEPASEAVIPLILAVKSHVSHSLTTFWPWMCDFTACADVTAHVWVSKSAGKVFEKREEPAEMSFTRTAQLKPLVSGRCAVILHRVPYSHLTA